jgi:hypothetical protein
MPRRRPPGRSRRNPGDSGDDLWGLPPPGDPDREAAIQQRLGGQVGPPVTVDSLMSMIYPAGGGASSRFPPSSVGEGLGIIINPKTFEPCLPFKVSSLKKSFGFYAGTDLSKRMGQGYFYDATGDKYDTSNSGFPRVHTPDGVRVERQGYGTVLYTTMCLAATLNEMRELRIPDIVSAQGISSNEHRSRAADSWWRKAREMQLVYSVDYETSGGATQPESNDFRDSLGNRPSRFSRPGARALWDAAAEYAADANGESVDDLADMDIDISSTFTREVESENENSGSADIYSFAADEVENVVGAETFVPFYTVGDFMSADAENIGDFWFDEKLFSTLLLTGCDPRVVRYVRDLTKMFGKPNLFEEIALVTLLNKRAIVIADETDGNVERYADLRPNPSLPASAAARKAFHSSLSKAERKLLSKRQDTIEELGLDQLVIDD